MTQERSVNEPTSALAAMVARAVGGASLPPVESWNPPFCGDLDLRIDRDGRWFYLGSPIGREALVRLFSTVLRREGDQYFLVTPVEKVGITVDDVPFIAVELVAEGEALAFRTNVGDLVQVDEQHRLRFAIEPEHQGLLPYLHVRAGLEARLSRAVMYQLVDLAQSDDDGRLFMMSAGIRFDLPEWEISA